MVKCPRCGIQVEAVHSVDSEMIAKFSELGESIPGQVCPSCLADLRKSSNMKAGGVLMAQEKAKEQHRLQLWKSRVGLIKKARSLMTQKRYSEAAVSYEKYLKILEIVFMCGKGEVLTPTKFKDSARTTELTVVASVYWDLLRIYDQNEKFHDRQNVTAKQLAMFLQYTPVYPDILKKAQAYVKHAKNPSAIKAFLKASAMETGRCFIATACFESPAAEEVIYLRWFRDFYLKKTKMGRAFVFYYYKFSPIVADFLDQNLIFKKVIKKILIWLVQFLMILGFGSCSSYDVKKNFKALDEKKSYSADSKILATENQKNQYHKWADKIYLKSEDEIAGEIIQTADALMRIYYKSRALVRAYDQQLDLALSNPELKSALAPESYKIQVFRRLLAEQEIKLYYLTEKFFWMRLSPLESEKSFERALKIQKIIDDKFIKKSFNTKYDWAAFQNFYAFIDDLFSDLLKQTRGLVRDNKGEIVKTSKGLEVLFGDEYFGLKSTEIFRKMNADKSFNKYLQEKMDASLGDVSLDQQVQEYAAPILKSAKEPSTPALRFVSGQNFKAKTLVLAFEQGPHTKFSNEIMDTFEKSNFQGALFWNYAHLADPKNKNTILRASKSGFVVGHDSWSNRFDFLRTKNESQFLNQEFDEAQKSIHQTMTSIIGLDYPVKFYRCPEGGCDGQASWPANGIGENSMGVSSVMDSFDDIDKDPVSLFLRTQKMIQLFGQGIVLGHDIYPQSSIFIEQLLPFLKNMEKKKEIRVVSLCQAVDEISAKEEAHWCPETMFKWQQK